MGNLPNLFKWLGPKGNRGTHIEFETGKYYHSSSISESLLKKFEQMGFIEFADDNNPPKLDVTLKVDNIKHESKSFFQKILGR